MRSNASSTLAAAWSSARASSGPREGKGRLQTSSGGGRVSWGPASVAGAGIITP